MHLTHSFWNDFYVKMERISQRACIYFFYPLLVTFVLEFKGDHQKCNVGHYTKKSVIYSNLITFRLKATYWSRKWCTDSIFGKSNPPSRGHCLLSAYRRLLLFIHLFIQSFTFSLVLGQSALLKNIRISWTINSRKSFVKLTAPTCKKAHCGFSNDV